MTTTGSGWWTAAPRAPEPAEVGARCKHCGEVLRSHQLVQQCPECDLVLHSDCYQATEGGRAYQTPDCENCRNRCHWR
jgi:hypothetical protein